MPDYNDIDLDRWRDYPEIITDSLWQFDKRDDTGGHELNYRGNFVPQIVQQALWRYTKKHDIVLDLFVGSGTTAIECLRQERRCIGVDLNYEVLTPVADKLDPDFNHPDLAFIHGDSSATMMRHDIWQLLGDKWNADSVDLVILHPPYGDIIQFSQDERDLSTMDLNGFLRSFAGVAENAYQLLRWGRFAVLVMGDAYQKGEWIPLGYHCMAQMKAFGFRLKSICVKNMSGNEGGSGGKNKNLWRYRCFAGGFYRFAHEQIFIFQKGG